MLLEESMYFSMDQFSWGCLYIERIIANIQAVTTKVKLAPELRNWMRIPQ